MDLDEIKRRMAERDYKQVDLANLLELAPNKISKAFSGERRFTVPEMDKIRAWLQSETDANHGSARTIPVIGQVAAGAWQEAVQTTRQTIPAPEDNMPSRAFGLTVQGDSMDKLIDDGGRIIVDPDDKALFPGRYYVVLNENGETTFKRFLADPARLAPCSNNPIHQPLMIGDGQNFTVIGRVIWRASPM